MHCSLQRYFNFEINKNIDFLYCFLRWILEPNYLVILRNPSWIRGLLQETNSLVSIPSKRALCVLFLGFCHIIFDRQRGEREAVEPSWHGSYFFIPPSSCTFYLESALVVLLCCSTAWFKTSLLTLSICGIFVIFLFSQIFPSINKYLSIKHQSIILFITISNMMPKNDVNSYFYMAW